jgi:hypothetical protein
MIINICLFLFVVDQSVACNVVNVEMCLSYGTGFGFGRLDLGKKMH